MEGASIWPRLKASHLSLSLGAELVHPPAGVCLQYRGGLRMQCLTQKSITQMVVDINRRERASSIVPAPWMGL